jgi:hypothetical protein
MANNELGSVRRSQNLNVYGPGAIIDFRAGKQSAPVSAVAAGLDAWNEFAPPADLFHKQTTFEPRLQEKLGVSGFRLPPVAIEIAPGVPDKRAGYLVGVRFPEWLQCPKCKLLQRHGKWAFQPGEAGLYCGQCTVDQGSHGKVHVIPVRFIAACERGHLEDFPWNWWVGHKTNECGGRLYLKNAGGAGLAGLILSCEECKAEQSMQGCFDKAALPTKGCRGNRPWLPSDDAQCGETMRALQRGASCLYFPVVASALDIPPFADRIQQQLGVYWQKIAGKETADARRNLIRDLEIDKDIGLPLDRLCAEVEGRIAGLGQGGLETIRNEEFKQFVEDPPVRLGEQAEFEIRPQIVPPELNGYIRSLVQATRLREVRALRAFTRIRPPDPSQRDANQTWAPISSTRKTWLPAIEVRGEGVFIELSPDALDEWEEREPEVLKHAATINDAYAADWAQRNDKAPAPRVISARFLLVHSLAHALVRQLGVDCGYSTASLRERLYVNDAEKMAALLIYTATPDSDGTLGGLASQAVPDRFVRTVESAVRAAAWCSSDPLCVSGVHAFTEATSGASCHACMLVPETSCEEFNRLLDRRMLVGSPDFPGLGFFRSLI